MNDRPTQVTVRVKLVDLDGTGVCKKTLPPNSGAQVSALVGTTKDRSSRFPAVGIEAPSPVRQPVGEICLDSGDNISHADFETHIETCVICNNRVELQLDFIETLELSIYQRKAEPDSSKVRGALLISAPKLNFAVCGEVDI